MDKLKELWSEEYQRKGIPSSFREDCTKTLIHFVSFLKEMGIDGGQALDLGCGRGRNAFYLAEQGFRVIGFDLVKDNVDVINQKAKDKPLPVVAKCQDMASPWPVGENAFDIAIDIFCYKHITNKSSQKIYRDSLRKALKPKGYFFLNLAANDDGFYGPLLASSPDPVIKLIIDPVSKIPSLLYSLEEIIHEFSDFNVIESKKITSTSPMYGKDYQRQVISLIFQKMN